MCTTAHLFTILQCAIRFFLGPDAKLSASYAAELIDGIKTDGNASALSPPALRTCPDPALTALAQLGTLRTATSHSFLSFFDQQLQYIVAEATPSTRLSPSLLLKDSGDELLLCGTARSRQDGICDHVVRGFDPDGLNIASAGIPLTKVDDLQSSPRFAKLPLPSLHGCPATFYAAVPIRTKRGINIGVYCVMNEHPVTWWDNTHTQAMQELSTIMMNHLEANRDRLAHRRSERMNRGLGSFLQQKSTLTNWQFGTFPAAYVNKEHLEGDLNAHHQAHESTPTSPATAGDDFQAYALPPETRPPFVASSHSQPHAELVSHGHGCTFASGASVTAKYDEGQPGRSSPTNIFGNAANIIREAIEVEGCVIFDPAVTAFASFSSQAAPWEDMALPAGQSSASSSEDKPSIDHPNQIASCSVLGFSTSTNHSINGDSDSASGTLIPQKLMIALLRRYPDGRIFNFDSNGDLLTSDSSDDSDKQVALGASTLSGSLPAKPPRTTTTSRATKTKPWARQDEGKIIFESFPGARSVAMVPNWDPKASKWRSVIFAYTETTGRHFTPREELDYLRAFGMLTTEVALRQQSVLADKAKADALSCISHELRSPLHGVILGVELLNDTELSVSQGNISHTIETCCRTLVDTIDHLLDFSKINYFMPISSNKKPIRARGQRQAANASVEAGLMTLVSNVNLGVLAEDVVESVFSGFYFQHLSIRQVLQKEASDLADRSAFAASDGTRAMEDLNISSLEQVNSALGAVSIFLMIDPTCCWDFITEGGAIRRIIMNLFGNSLKHTRDGVIHVSLTQRARKPENRLTLKKQSQQVIITITDTGSGISQDYLENRLFQPFTQEDDLSPGTGLGLSIVKKIVSHLRGRISVKSKVGLGTTVTVALPLRPIASVPGELPHTVERDDFRSAVNELQGLRVCVLGFKVTGATTSKVDMEGNAFDTFSILRSICADWLKLVVIEAEDIARFSPDLIIASDDMVEELSRHKTLTKAPTIIVCRNALVAHQKAFQYPSKRDRKASLEYISQP